MAGDEAFGTQDAGAGFELAGKGVDGDNMGRFVVPRTVFTPIGGGDFRPGVVECAVCGEDFHYGCVGARVRRDGGEGDERF